MCKQKFEDILNMSKFNDFIKKHQKQEEKKNTLLWVLAIIGTMAAVAGIAYAVYKYVVPKYFDEFDDDFDDFEDEYYDEDEDDEALDVEEETEI